MNDQIGTEAAYYRGGTSKALFVHRSDLPTTTDEQLDDWVLAVFGSPDRREIDGIGGGDITTSKFAIIGPPSRSDADIDYSFFQVGIDVPAVGRDVNCGNISAAVGPYAIENGLVSTEEPTTTVHIHNTSDNTMIHAEVPVNEGHARVIGDEQIDGVPGTGAPVRLDFRDSTGGRTGRLLPTGNVCDTLNVEGIGEVDVTVVDIANLIAYVPAEALGLVGNEDPDTIEGNTELMERIERLRGTVATEIGLASSLESSKEEAPGTPFVSIVSQPAQWVDYNSQQTHKADECDLTARGITMGSTHKAYWGTGSICTGVAASLQGSVVNAVARPDAVGSGRFRIGHPGGIIEVEVEVEENEESGFVVRKGALLRTARKIMDGTVYASKARLPWLAQTEQYEPVGS
jgi:2-methylaconitate cis-trans-isomerase PrpF